MEIRPQVFSTTRNLNRVPTIPRSRKKDALRRLFSTPSSPQAKASIARRFKALRKKALLTQSDLGDLIGLCRQSVNKIENRRVWPHYTTWDKFREVESNRNLHRVCFPVNWR